MKKKERFDSFIFSHIPKCGGTSFRKFIYDSSIYSNINKASIYIPGLNNIPNTKNLSQLNELELAKVQIKKIRILADHSKVKSHINFNLKTKNPFYFTILRNPVERFISHYNFFYRKLDYSKCKDIHLNDLESKKLSRILNANSNIQIHYIAGRRDSEEKNTKQMFRRAIYNLEHTISAFAILEDIDKSLSLLKVNSPKWLKFPERFPTSNKNNLNKSNEIKSEIVEQIRHYNQLDIELYKYALKLFDLRYSINNNIIEKLKFENGISKV